jgi:hypothetical protein
LKNSKIFNLGAVTFSPVSRSSSVGLVFFMDHNNKNNDSILQLVLFLSFC